MAHILEEKKKQEKPLGTFILFQTFNFNDLVAPKLCPMHGSLAHATNCKHEVRLEAGIYGGPLQALFRAM